MIGGYTNYRCLTAKDVEIFRKATQNLTGCSYHPCRVATQVVSGTNYKFLAEQTCTTFPPTKKCVEVIIYVDLSNNIKLVSITDRKK